MVKRTGLLVLLGLALVSRAGSAQAREMSVVEEQPTLTNFEAVRHAIEREYPAPLRALGRGGTTVVLIDLDRRGRTSNIRVGRSSGDLALDSAALRVSEVMRFRPTRINGRAEPTTVEFPVTFAPLGVTKEASEPPRDP